MARRVAGQAWRVGRAGVAIAAILAGAAHAQVTPNAAPPAAFDREAYSEPVLTARLVELVNATRAEARDCGSTRFAAAPALRRHPQLDAAAGAHARDLAAQGIFELQGSDGSTTATRVERAGYRWSGVGENLIDRHLTPEPIVENWLDDPVQCSNIMHPAFTEVGAARSPWEPGSRARIVWSLVVARPRGPAR
jgi:uncharacterized protein YkwD